MEMDVETICPCFLYLQQGQRLDCIICQIIVFTGSVQLELDHDAATYVCLCVHPSSSWLALGDQIQQDYLKIKALSFVSGQLSAGSTTLLEDKDSLQLLASDTLTSLITMTMKLVKPTTTLLLS